MCLGEAKFGINWEGGYQDRLSTKNSKVEVNTFTPEIKGVGKGWGAAPDQE